MRPRGWPAVESQFHCGGTGRRGLFGKSSGGYGAMIHAMLHADVWAAAACHSGDMAFELVYASDFPRVARALAKCDGSIKTWLDTFESKQKKSGDDIHVLMTLAMAATYDPDPQAPNGFRVPYNLETGELLTTPGSLMYAQG